MDGDQTLSSQRESALIELEKRIEIVSVKLSSYNLNLSNICDNLMGNAPEEKTDAADAPQSPGMIGALTAVIGRLEHKTNIICRTINRLEESNII